MAVTEGKYVTTPRDFPVPADRNIEANKSVIVVKHKNNNLRLLIKNTKYQLHQKYFTLLSLIETKNKKRKKKKRNLLEFSRLQAIVPNSYHLMSIERTENAKENL